MVKIFRQTPQVDWIGQRTKYFALSGALLAASLFSLATKGINWGIDFTGGSLIQLTFSTPTTLEELRGLLSASGYPEAVPQRFLGTESYSIRIKTSAQEGPSVTEKFLVDFSASSKGKTFTVDAKEFVGPTVGRHLYKQALFAVLFSTIGILVYVGFRFSNPLWGVAGIIGLVHDVVAVLGLISIFGMEMDLVLLAAVMTIAGYSINDTIVIFDRIRERMRTQRRESLAELLNASINDTLSRTIMTALTAFLTSIALLLFGGAVIHDFAAAISFGIIIGCYSTVGICSAFVYVWSTRQAPSAAVEPAPSLPTASQPSSSHGGKRARRRGHA